MLLAVPLAACGEALQGLAPTYRTTKNGARPLAFQTEAIARSFAVGQEHQWAATLAKLLSDGVPFLRAAKERGVVAEVRLTGYTPQGSDIETYAVDLAVAAPPDPKTKKPREPVVLPGKAGTKEAAYDAEAEKAERATGMAAAEIKKGHFAIYALLNMMTALNASNTSLQKHAFALLVVREKVKAGEKADWSDPNRPLAETEADVADSLAVVAEHRDFVQGLRGEVLLLATLVGRYRDEGVIEELERRAAGFRDAAKAWMAAHPPLTMQEIETRVRAYVASPTAMLDELEEKLRFVSAAAQIAKGVVTGSPSATLDGIAKLAPKDSTARTALEGFAAAARGDVVKAADAAATLAGSSTKASDVKDGFQTAKRLAKVP